MGRIVKKLSRKTIFRMTFLFVGFIISTVLFVSTFFSYTTQIYKTKQEIAEIKEIYNEKLEDEEELKSEISKLQDPEYMAKYAREKYLYSGKDEIIIKIEE